MNFEILYFRDCAVRRRQRQEAIVDRRNGCQQLRLVGIGRLPASHHVAFDQQLVVAVVGATGIADADRYLVRSLRERNLPGCAFGIGAEIEMSVACEARIVAVEGGTCPLVDGNARIRSAIDRCGGCPVGICCRGFRHPAITQAVSTVAESFEVIDQVSDDVRSCTILEVDRDCGTRAGFHAVVTEAHGNTVNIWAVRDRVFQAN